MSYRELTAADITLYVGPNRYQMFMYALAETGRDADLEGCNDFFWDAADSKAGPGDRSEEVDAPSPIYGAEDVDDK